MRLLEQGCDRRVSILLRNNLAIWLSHLHPGLARIFTMFLCKWLSYFLTVTKGTGFDELQVVLLGHQSPEPGSRNLDTWGTWQGDVLRRRDDGRRTYWLWDARFCRLLFNYSYNGLRYWHGRRFRQPKELPSKASYERGTLAPWNPPQKLECVVSTGTSEIP